ncbi:uncharacterized protein EDB91DRAFT_1080014 [Suillus paluster]|uniref:uncharacterized protein n=1 Tax=Suillus paluster TaxID=48578 RepID=UPI001B87B048|nr:uncharacterized protein EDB91DRAFT_1080014 [Suillus paluster]KAG1746710.1 hypothetical protein EDB91DRAFT_1080014 [Suillus paluster]
MITTAVNGATRLTIASYLSVACFKEVVWDSTVQLIHGTKSVSNLGAIASNMCISPAILVSASNKATRITLSDFNKELAPKHDLAQPNPPFTGDISTPPASSSLNPTTTRTTSSPSIDSDTKVMVTEALSASNPPPGMKTLTPGDSDGPTLQPFILLVDNLHQTTSAIPNLAAHLGSASPIEELPWTTRPHLKPPDMKRATNRLLPHPATALLHQRSHLSKQKYGPRASRLIAVRDSIAHSHLKQDNIMIIYDEILVDRAALVDGWAAAMAELGLTSMLSPPSLSLPNTTNRGLSAT